METHYTHHLFHKALQPSQLIALQNLKAQSLEIRALYGPAKLAEINKELEEMKATREKLIPVFNRHWGE